MSPGAGVSTDLRPVEAPAHDPEPRGDLAVPARAPGLSRRSPAWKRHWEASAWAPVALKALGIFAGMLTLAGIGAASTLAGSGVPVVVGAPQPSSVWVAPGPASGPLPGTDGHGIAGATAPPAAPASPASAGPSGPSATTPSAGVTADGKIVLNAATAEELQRLPKIGAKRAQAIIELRTRLGKFRQPTDLLRVRGIGRKTLRQLTPLLVLDAPR